MNKIPGCCPSCNGQLAVTELQCKKCATTIKGDFFMPLMAALNQEDELFLKVFLETRGNIKEMEKRLGISYPTVRIQLDQLIQSLGLGTPPPDYSRRRIEILTRLEEKEITASEALKALKEIGKEGSL
ncbi:MAG: DUF2089 domain-containing protein [Planctomycetota bacterium]